jgi:hypothetical protein
VLVLDAPGKGDFDKSGFEIFFDVVFECLEGGDGFFGVKGSVEKLFVKFSRFASKSVPFFLGNSVQVFSSKESSCKRTPSDQTIIVLLEEFLIVEFHFLSDEQIVLILSTDGFVQIVLFTEPEGIEDVLGIPVAGAPVKGLAVFYEFVKGAADLLEGCVLIVAMSEEHVDVVKLKPGEGLIDSLTNMFSVDVGGAVSFGVMAGPDFGGDDDILTRDVKVFEDFACNKYEQYLRFFLTLPWHRSQQCQRS